MSTKSKKRNKLRRLMQEAGSRRLINSEYRRGFMEGHIAAITKMAGCMDDLLHKNDNIASLPTDWNEFYVELSKGRKEK